MIGGLFTFLGAIGTVVKGLVAWLTNSRLKAEIRHDIEAEAAKDQALRTVDAGAAVQQVQQETHATVEDILQKPAQERMRLLRERLATTNRLRRV